MELTQVMRTNGAARDFDGRPVDDAVLQRILDIARFAPSGGNRQPWRVLLVRDPHLLAEIARLTELAYEEYAAIRAAGRVPFAPGPDGRWHGLPDLSGPPPTTPQPGVRFVPDFDRVPVVLLVAVKLPDLVVADIELDRVPVVGGASVYPFCQNILLAAADEGLAGALTTIVIRYEAELAPLVGLPEGHGLAALVLLGHPVQRVTRLRRRPVAEFTTVDRFDGPPFGT